MPGISKSLTYLLNEHVQPGLFLMRAKAAVRSLAAFSSVSWGMRAMGTLALGNAVSRGLWAQVGSVGTEGVGVCVCLPMFGSVQAESSQ